MLPTLASPEVIPTPTVSVVTRAQRGDRAALATVVRAITRPVHALVWRLLAGAPAADVEDVAQDALVKVIGALRRFDPHGEAQLSTWAVTIASRTAIDWLRRTRRRGDLRPSAERGAAAWWRPAPDPESTSAERQLATRVSRLMAGLPDDQRAALVLRAYHDLDYPEIARALKVRVGTVKSRIARARAALRVGLEEANDG